MRIPAIALSLAFYCPPALAQTQATLWLRPGDAGLLKASAAGFAEPKARKAIYREAIFYSKGLWGPTRNVRIVVQPPLACARNLGAAQASNSNPSPTIEVIRAICDGRIAILVFEDTPTLEEHWKVVRGRC